MSATASMLTGSHSEANLRPAPFPANPDIRCTGRRPVWRVLRTASLSVILLAALAQCGTTAPAAARAANVQRAASSASTMDSFIAEAASRFRIPASWIRAVIHVESNGNASAVSPKGAIGLMQIMPDTWADLAQRYRLGSDPTSAHDNIVGGTAYLRELYDRFGPTGFLAAYNAGPQRYQRYLINGQPLADETRRYMAQLAAALPDLPRDPLLTATPISLDWRGASVFAGLAEPLAPVDLALSVVPSGGNPPSGQNGLVSRLTPHAADLFAPVSARSVP